MMREVFSKELRNAHLAIPDGDPIKAIALAEIRGRARLAFELGLLSEDGLGWVVGRSVCSSAPGTRRNEDIGAKA